MVKNTWSSEGYRWQDENNMSGRDSLLAKVK